MVFSLGYLSSSRPNQNVLAFTFRIQIFLIEVRAAGTHSMLEGWKLAFRTNLELQNDLSEFILWARRKQNFNESQRYSSTMCPR